MPRKNTLIAMSNFDRKIEKKGWISWPKSMEKFSTGWINENGEKLLRFCSINVQGLMNTINKQTSITDRKTQNQKYFIIVPKDKRGSKSVLHTNILRRFNNHS